MMAKWKGGCISSGPIEKGKGGKVKGSPSGLSYKNDGGAVKHSFFVKILYLAVNGRGRLSGFDLLALNVCLTDEIEKPLRSANIDSYIRITDTGRESINRKVFFIFTLYNTLKDNDQLKISQLGASSSEDAGKWIRSLQTAVVKECPNPEKEFMSFSKKNWPPFKNEAVTSDVIAPSTWKIFGCQNGLRLFKEAKDWDSRGRLWDDHPAIMAVGVVNGTPEAIFRALMSLGASRSEWDFCFYRGSVVEHLDGHTDIIHKKLYSNWLPWGMRRRDLLLRRYWRREEDGNIW
ncbi:hypothetical protein OIU78_005719 [Salix suchowensis]|nr:hypothetical protein OIU78_005719 [Salix suchowensis]